jgi:hypothetical protein
MAARDPAAPAAPAAPAGAPAPAAGPGDPDAQAAIDARDISAIKDLRDYGRATRSQRFQMMEILLAQAWVGPRDEYALEALWDSFGSHGVAAAYDERRDLWDQCVDRGAELYDIGAVQGVRSRFRSDVTALARVYLAANRQAVLAEAGRLGLGDLGAPAPAGGPDRGRMAEVQQLARELARADEALAQMQSVPVGYEWETIDSPGGSMRSSKVVANYSPSGPPPVRPAPEEQPRFARWEEVDEQYRAVSRARAVLAARSPALFAVAGERGAAGAIARASPEEAAARLRELLGRTLRNIDQTLPKLDSGDLDWRDLVPLHDQLYAGLPSESGTQWSRPLFKGVAADVIGDYQAREFWIALGLGTLAAAAFIFSEIATGGMATFLWASVGVAAGGVQAGRSWERYEDLATAAGAASSEDTRLVGEGQVTEAAISAVLDTAFAFLDAAGAVRGVRAAVRATAARDAIGRLAQLGDREAREAVEAAVRELGPQETIRRSGRSPEELASLVGPDTDAGRALRDAAGDVTVARPAPANVAAGTVPAGEITPAARQLAARMQGLLERWSGLTPLERLEELVRQVNADFAHTGMPPLDAVGLARGTRLGELNFASWELAVRSDLFSRATITAEEFAQLVNTARHEAQHGFQWFRMAQLEATTGANAREIAQKLGIPEEVAEAAIEVQNGFRRGERLVAGTAAEAEARRWLEGVYGGGRAHRERTLRELADAADELTRATDDWTAARELTEPNPVKDAARRRYEAAVRRRETAYQAYRGLAEEADAWRAGDVAEAAMRERLQLAEQLGAARRAEREAFEAYKPLEDLYVWAVSRPNTHLTYDRLLAYHRALDAWKRALDAVSSLEHRLSVAAAGGAAPARARP